MSRLQLLKSAVECVMTVGSKVGRLSGPHPHGNAAKATADLRSGRFLVRAM